MAHTLRFSYSLPSVSAKALHLVDATAVAIHGEWRIAVPLARIARHSDGGRCVCGHRSTKLLVRLLGRCAVGR